MGLLVALTGFAAGETTPLVLDPKDRILILAPHPDDEMLCCGGVIQNALAKHIPLKIVFLTHGDFNKWAFSLYQHSPVFRPKTMRAMGEVRRREALAAAHVLGVPADALLFLGYPDYGTLAIWDAHWAASPPYESPNTRVHAVPYPSAYRPQAPYKGDAILQDLEAVIRDFQPTMIFAPHPADTNVDHRALSLYLYVALQDLRQGPDIYTYLVHFPHWPAQRGFRPTQDDTWPQALKNQNAWKVLTLSPAEITQKYTALEKHQTQTAYSKRYLRAFVRRNELFGVEALKQMGVSTDGKAWQVTTDSADVVIAGELDETHSMAKGWAIAVDGYRPDIPFAHMPKIQLRMKAHHLSVYDQQKLILDSGVNVTWSQGQVTFHIPCQLLNHPATLLIGYGPLRPRKPFGWDAQQIISLQD